MPVREMNRVNNNSQQLIITCKFGNIIYFVIITISPNVTFGVSVSNLSTVVFS